MSLQVGMKVIGSVKLAKQLERLSDKVPSAAKSSMIYACEFVRGYIVKYKLSGQVLKRRSGHLAGSITSEVRGSNESDVVGRVGTNLKYARIHEFGGDIRPVRAKALHFFIGKIEIFTQHVKIPKRPYIKPAIEELAPKLSKILGKKFESELKRGL